MNQIILFLLFSTITTESAYAQKQDMPVSTQLERVALDINSERTLVPVNGSIDVVRGDLLTLIDAWAKDPGTKIDVMDFVGYAPLRSNTGRDDRGFIINTAVDLKPQFAKDAGKSVFEIQVRSGTNTLGSVFIHVVEPRLERVEVSVNGKIQQLHDGDVLALRPIDKIAVRHVFTNVRGNENVRHDLRKIASPKGKPNRELVFARGDLVFGRIRLQWQE